MIIPKRTLFYSCVRTLQDGNMKTLASCKLLSTVQDFICDH
jgi:hypothetical protein